jgi:phosphatidylglycerophosphate synthase
MTLDKVAAGDKFVDLSDYARPVARRLTRALVPTPITPLQVTLAYTVVGFVAAGLFASGGYWPGVVAGVLLLVKSTLDAVDGSLARARHHRSRVGRFADSVCDYVINAAVFLGLALHGGSLTVHGAVLAVVALELATWQGSTFSYYYVYYRRLTGGDTTSELQETEPRSYPWDDPRVVQVLLTMYKIIYGWQDALLGKIDRAITPDGSSPIYRNKRLLTAVTVMGLGFQLLLIAICAWSDRASWALLMFLGPLNVYWAVIMLVRVGLSRRLPARHAAG